MAIRPDFSRALTTKGIRVRLAGRYYKFRITDSGILKGDDGWAHHNGVKGKELRVRKTYDLAAKESHPDPLLTSLLHEFLHAVDWSVKDEVVDHTTKHLGFLLHLSGWRLLPLFFNVEVKEDNLASMIGHGLGLMEVQREEHPWIEGAARDMAHVLWRLGYRREV